MVEHTRDDGGELQEAKFYPVNGLRGNCVCGHFIQYTHEGETECESCGRTWNIYVTGEQID